MITIGQQQIEVLKNISIIYKYQSLPLGYSSSLSKAFEITTRHAVHQKKRYCPHTCTEVLNLE